jgi:hypothetical protein
MPNVPTEAQEQAALFQWIAYKAKQYPELQYCYHIPNGGSRNPIEARHLKEQGVKPGIPDLFLPCARGGWHGLYIEMKRRKGGRLSDEQAAMLEALREQGYCAWVCKGANDAIELITEYLSNGNNTTMQGLL